MSWDPLALSLISACTALVASVAGPVVALLVSTRQFSAAVLSANRQKWIETLRDSLAELVSLIVAAVVVRAGWKSQWNRGLGPVTEERAMLQKLERIVLVQWKIRLLLNPNEEDHQQLNLAIETALKRLQSEAATDAETDADLASITRLGQAILKREWVRVKRGT